MHRLLLIAILAAPLPAQQRFDVASVRPNKSGAARYGVTPQGGRFTATNMTLFALVQWAYQLEDFEVTGAPAWTKSDRFDISAEAQGTPSVAQFRVLLQPLLADRFHLKVHKQKKNLPVYELSLAKGGSKLREAKCVGTPGPANPCGGTSGSTRGTLIGRAAAIPILAKALSGILSRPVLDKTKLAGEYDFDLTWTPDETSRRGPGDQDAPPADVKGPSLFTAVQEQLGLTLKSKKGQVEVLVVDHAETPTEN